MELRYQMNDILPLLSIPQPPAGRSSYNIPCPLCENPNTRQGHLNINLKKNVFRCTKCGSFEGGVFDLYAYYKNISVKDVLASLRGEGPQQLTVQSQRKNAKQLPKPVEIPQAKLASIEDRDRTYQVLLNKLTLAPDHRENLLGRGLDDSEIDRLQYRTTPVVGFLALADELAGKDAISLVCPVFTKIKAGNGR